MDKLTIKNAEKRRSEILKALPVMKVRPGWIKYMRSVLGITLKNLAGLTGLSLPTIAQAEKREAQGKVTIGTLTKIAHAMDCDLVYAFVPRDEVSSLMRKKAKEKARKTILQADTHMSLEDQQVSEDLEFRIESLAEKLLEKGQIW